MKPMSAYLKTMIPDRLDEVLVPLSKNEAVVPPYSEVWQALTTLRQALEPLGQREAFDAFLDLYRSYLCEEHVACYMQGICDARWFLEGAKDE